MTFLQICQAVNNLSGTQGTLSTTEGLSGTYQASMVEITKSAWLDIQNLRKDWDFLRTTVALTMVVGQSEYTLSDLGVTNIGHWISPMILYDPSTSTSNTPLMKVSYDYFKRYGIASNDNAQPSIFAVDPVDNHLYINPPDSTYSITAHYFQKPEALTLDADTPLGPSEFHWAIVYRALADWGIFFGNLSLYQLYSQKADSIIGSLMRSDLPVKRINLRGLV